MAEEPPVAGFVGRHWARHRDKVLYLVVGAWNSLFTYLVFSLLWWLLEAHLYPSVILVLVYVIAAVNGFLTFRYLVFGPAGRAPAEFLRYQVVYLPLLLVNMVLLPAALRYSSLNAYAIEALFALFAVVVGYLGSKYYTFRRRSG